VNVKQFANECRGKDLPYYACPRAHYSKIEQYYEFQSMTVKRLVKSKGVKHQQVVRITSKLQKMILNSLLSTKEIIPYTIGISSEPNDYVALEVATSIIHSLVEFTGQEWSTHRIGYSSPAPDGRILLIYNILPEREKLYEIRNAILNNPNKLKIVVVGGTTALDFFDNYLRLPISGVLHVSGTPNIKTKVDGLKYDTEDNYPVFSKDFDILHKIAEKLICHPNTGRNTSS